MKKNAECECILCVDAFMHSTVELSVYEYIMDPLNYGLRECIGIYMCLCTSVCDFMHLCVYMCVSLLSPQGGVGMHIL